MKALHPLFLPTFDEWKAENPGLFYGISDEEAYFYFEQGKQLREHKLATERTALQKQRATARYVESVQLQVRLAAYKQSRREEEQSRREEEKRKRQLEIKEEKRRRKLEGDDHSDEPPQYSEKERRSRINWFGILPADIARRQIAYEREKTVAAMRDAGMTYQEIGKNKGISKERVRQIVFRAGLRKSSPAEQYLSKKIDCEQLVPATATLAMFAEKRKPRDWMYV